MFSKISTVWHIFTILQNKYHISQLYFRDITLTYHLSVCVCVTVAPEANEMQPVPMTSAVNSADRLKAEFPRRTEL